MQNGMITTQLTPHHRLYFVPTSRILILPSKSGKTGRRLTCRLVGRQVCRLGGGGGLQCLVTTPSFWRPFHLCWPLVSFVYRRLSRGKWGICGVKGSPMIAVMDLTGLSLYVWFQNTSSHIFGPCRGPPSQGVPALRRFSNSCNHQTIPQTPKPSNQLQVLIWRSWLVRTFRSVIHVVHVGLPLSLPQHVPCPTCPTPPGPFPGTVTLCSPKKIAHLTVEATNTCIYTVLWSWISNHPQPPFWPFLTPGVVLCHHTVL